MVRCDVLIVGGGPAGSACARDLVRAGCDVVVADRARFPRDKPCAGWITPAVVETLDLDLDAYRRAGLTLQPITGFRTGIVGRRRAADVDFGRVVSYGIRRCEFDAYLLERSGARVLAPMPVARLSRERDRWVVDGAIEARIVVGAGGHFCPVAASLNPGPPRGPLVAAQEIELPAGGEGGSAATPERPALYFCPELDGYGWVFRKGRFVNVGFGRESGSGRRRDLAASTRAFHAWAEQTGLVPAGLPRTWRGHAYLLYGRPRRRVCGDGIVLVGDAAGLAHPVSGEGILPAVESGRLAARAVLASAGRDGREALAWYEEALSRRYGPPPDPRGWSRRLPPAIARPIGRRLIASSWFARHVLLARWFLHVQQPPLALSH
jgi:flavin-dependent dehydrogenase